MSGCKVISYGNTQGIEQVLVISAAATSELAVL